MSKSIFCLPMILALSSSVFAVQWTDDTGKYHIEGEFAGISNGVVTIQKVNGAKVHIPFDRLSKDDRVRVDKMKSHFGNNNDPFVIAEAEKIPVDPVEHSTNFLQNTIVLLKTEIEHVAQEDTQEKRTAAHDKLLKTFKKEFEDKPISIRFEIKDISASRELVGRYRLTLAYPQGIDEYGLAAGEYNIPLTKPEALKVSAGDYLLLSGKAVLNCSNSEYVNFGDATHGRMILSYYSRSSGWSYAVALRDCHAKIEKKTEKPPHPAAN